MPVYFIDSMTFLCLKKRKCYDAIDQSFKVIDCHVTLKLDILKHERLKCVQLKLNMLSLLSFFNHYNEAIVSLLQSQ